MLQPDVWRVSFVKWKFSHGWKNPPNYYSIFYNTGLFEMIVGVLTTCHLVLQMQPHVICFCGVTSRIRFMFLLFPQVSRNWRYELEPPLKPSPLTCYRQFGTNSIIVFMFVESQRVVLLNKKTHILQCQVYCVWQVAKTPTIISNNPVQWKYA